MPANKETNIFIHYGYYLEFKNCNYIISFLDNLLIVSNACARIFKVRKGDALPSRMGLKNTPTAPLQWGNPHNDCPDNATKQSDGEVPVILEL